MGSSPSGLPVGAGEGPVTVLPVVRKDGPLVGAVVAASALQVPGGGLAVASALEALSAAGPYRAPSRVIPGIRASGQRMGTGLAVTAVARPIAARDELH